MLPPLNPHYKYNCIIIQVNDDQEVRYVLNVINKILNTFSDEIIRSMQEYMSNGESPYYRVYRNNSDNIVYSVGPISRVEELSRNGGYTYEKIFNADDVKKGVIKNIIEKGESIIRPSYKPRKIERTFESTKWYPYRFKTEIEFEKEFGSGWCKKVALSWVDAMDYLFNKPYPYMVKKGDMLSPIDNSWSVSWDMLTPNTREPSYKPRKIERTFESDDNYLYNVIVFSVKNPTENEICQTELLKHGVKWQGLSLDIRKFNERNYPMFLFSEYKEKDISYTTKDNINNGDIEQYIRTCISQGENICTTVFNFDDAKHLKNIMKTGKIGPSYKPRKIERSFESVNEKWYPYRFKTKKEFVDEYGGNWRTGNSDDVARFVGGMESLCGTDYQFDVKPGDELPSLPWNMGGWLVEWFMLTPNPKIPNYKPKKIERTFESVEEDKWYPYRFKTKKEFEDEFGEYWYDMINYGWSTDGEMDHLFNQDYPFNVKKVDYKEDEELPYIYYDNGEQYWLISWDMLISKGPKKPSYKPKKIERTFESDYYEFPYRFKTKKEFESEYGADVLTSGGYRGTLKWRIGNGAMVSCSWIEEMDDLFGQVYPYSIKKDTRDNDLPMMGDYHINWFMLTPNKPTEPSYRPKKIVRTFESFEHIPVYPDVPPTLTVDEQRKLFKEGEYAWVRPDAFSLFRDVDPRMNKYLGKKVIINSVDSIMNKYGEYYLNSGVNVIGGGDLDDLLVYCKFENESEEWYWYYKCLIPTIRKPDYSPKRIVREAKNNLNFRYKYINIHIKDEETNIVQEMLFKMGYLWFGDFKPRYQIRENEVVLCINTEDKQLTYYNSLEYYNTSKDTNKDVDPKLYTFNDIESIEKLLKYGYAPDYAPKKLIRESIDTTSQDVLDHYLKLYPTISKPTCKIGDKVRIKTNYLDIIESNPHYQTFYSEGRKRDTERISNQDLTVILKYRYNNEPHNPWWSEVVNEYDIHTFVIDDLLDKVKITPNYTPKRIERTFESVEENYLTDNYPYTSIVIVLNSRNEVRECENLLLTELGIEIMRGVYGSISDRPVPHYIRLAKSNNNLINKGYSTLNTLGDNSITTQNTHEKLFYLSDLKSGLISRILKYGKIPDYTPKKITREL